MDDATTETTTVRTDKLSIAMEVSGPAAGRVAILLHGWPDDVRTWDGVKPALHAAGWRTIVPYLRGFGPTTFHEGVPHSGDLEAFGRDVIDMMDAMGLERAVLIGHDWGARAAYNAAHLAPERVEACVAVSVGWGTNTADQTLTLEQHHRYWYHWLFSTARGAALVANDRRGLTRYIWRIWAPDNPLTDDAFEQTAPAFDNPAWADVTVHSYSVRWGNAVPDPAYDAIRAAQAADMTIRVPTLMVHGGADPVTDPALSQGRESMFADRYERIVMDGLGHFPSREDPDGLARHILAFIG